MAKEEMVKKIREALKKIETDKREFSLAMLIPTEPNVIDSKLSLIVSAPWLDKMNPKQAIELIVKGLKEHLDSSSLSYVSRVTIVNSSDDFVKAINSAFYVKEGLVNITNCTISGMQIDRAILLESHRVNDSKEGFSGSNVIPK